MQLLGDGRGALSSHEQRHHLPLTNAQVRELDMLERHGRAWGNFRGKPEGLEFEGDLVDGPPKFSAAAPRHRLGGLHRPEVDDDGDTPDDLPRLVGETLRNQEHGERRSVLASKHAQAHAEVTGLDGLDFFGRRVDQVGGHELVDRPAFDFGAVVLEPFEQTRIGENHDTGVVASHDSTVDRVHRPQNLVLADLYVHSLTSVAPACIAHQLAHPGSWTAGRRLSDLVYTRIPSSVRGDRKASVRDARWVIEKSRAQVMVARRKQP